MHRLNLPAYSFKIKKEAEREYIFDVIRKKYLRLQPEEWVRQNFIQFLVQEKNYPTSLIEIEKGLKLNTLQKRADAVVSSSLGKPLVLIEFKAPKVKITQDTFEQIARYNKVFKVPYLIVSNGLEHYCCKVDFDNSAFAFLEDIPDYSIL